MARIAFRQINFKPKTLEIIELANQISSSYRRQGLDLTLRQLYYQFIARDFFPNTEQSYNRLGEIINDARLAGHFDWDHLKDRGRAAHQTEWIDNWEQSIAELIDDAADGFYVDLWKDQPRRVEVWVEKQALEQVVQRAANGTRSGYFACKGYVSASAMYDAAQRIAHIINQGQEPLILHLGDHDPSGIDMTRDNQDRLEEMVGQPVEFRRLALNMEQIDELNPPPNPTKLSDSRSPKYIQEYGHTSWELDAIQPERLVSIIQTEIDSVLDLDLYSAQVQREKRIRHTYATEIRGVASHWDEALEHLTSLYPEDFEE